MSANSRRAGVGGDQMHVIVMLIAAAVVAGLAAAVAWLVPTVASWVHSGQLPHLELEKAVKAVVDGDLWGSDPAPPIRRGSPSCSRAAAGFGSWRRSP